ncbi:histidine phosphatase family protein [Nocardioides sp. WS12]|uniref:histidine phosphatase family protein n=1 Tax=Nocardioides sp. WS12 TaxID=2486272 RepID=UPI0015FBCFA4|nr:histidine phosphatase family protein [Nocardioides sp. WS12]
MADSAYLVRHGATEWSVSGKHTSSTDLPLLPEGEEGARLLAPRLASIEFAEVLTSPMQRARRTAEIAGFGGAEVCPDLVEWGYGDYEGRTTPDIRAEVPGWSVWTHGCPGGESGADVTVRCDRVVERILAASGPVLLFAHGHLLRALAARWIGLTASDGRLFRLDTATVSELGHERETPVLLRWNA